MGVRTVYEGRGEMGLKKEDLIVRYIEICYLQNTIPEHMLNQICLLIQHIAVFAEEVAWCPPIGPHSRCRHSHGFSHVSCQSCAVRQLQIPAYCCGQFKIRQGVEKVVHNVPPVTVDIDE